MNLKDYRISDLVRHYNLLAGGTRGPDPKPLNEKAMRLTRDELEKIAEKILEACKASHGTAEWDEAASNEVAVLGGLNSRIHGRLLNLLIAGIDCDPLFSAPKLRGLALVFLRDAALALDPEAVDAAGHEYGGEGMEGIVSTALTLLACKLNALVEEADQEGLFQVIDGLNVLLTVLASMTASAPRADSASELLGVLDRCRNLPERAAATAQSGGDPARPAE